MKKSHLVFLFVIFILFCFSTGLAQGHQHATASTADGDFNPSLVSDHRGGFYLAYIARSNGTSNVMLRHSADGKTFSQPLRVNGLLGDAAVRNENPPKIAVAPNGTVYLCWANERARWKGNIRFARSTDKGKSFSQAITLNSDAVGEPTGHAFQSLAVDRAGKVYVAWIDERNKREADRGAEIWLAVSKDQGKTFSFNRKILADVCECCRTTIQVDANGRIYLSYRTVPASGPMFRDIVVASSSDGGRSFQQTVVSQDLWDINACPVAGPSLTMDRKGRLCVVWFTGGGQRPGLYYAASSDHGASYSQRKPLDTDQHFGKHAQAVARPDGKLIVSWDDQTDQQVSFWGVLDTRQGLLHKSAAHRQMSYPTVAIGATTVVLGGLQAANGIVVKSETMK
jgi:hypothetical protein